MFWLWEFQFCKASKDRGTLLPYQGQWRFQVNVFMSNFSSYSLDLTTPCNNCHVLVPVVYFKEMKPFWFGLLCVSYVLTHVVWMLQSVPVDVNFSVSYQPRDLGYSALLRLTSLWWTKILFNVDCWESKVVRKRHFTLKWQKHIEISCQAFTLRF